MTAPTELDERAIDVAIESLGIEFLRELRAIAWFCDCGADGKMALVPSDRRHWYEPGGKMEPLASTGCVRLLKPSYCATVRQHRPSIRVEQFGRRVLVRARAMRLPIEIDDDQPCSLPASEAGWRDVKAELPPLEQVVIIRYPSGYDGGDVFAWGARVDDGEGWMWGVKTGYDASIRPSEDASWNGVEVDDDYPVTHWMPLPSAPDRRPA